MPSVHAAHSTRAAPRRTTSRGATRTRGRTCTWPTYLHVARRGMTARIQRTKEEPKEADPLAERSRPPAARVRTRTAPRRRRVIRLYVGRRPVHVFGFAMHACLDDGPDVHAHVAMRDTPRRSTPCRSKNPKSRQSLQRPRSSRPRASVMGGPRELRAFTESCTRMADGRRTQEDSLGRREVGRGVGTVQGIGAVDTRHRAKRGQSRKRAGGAERQEWRENARSTRPSKISTRIEGYISGSLRDEARRRGER